MTKSNPFNEYLRQRLDFLGLSARDLTKLMKMKQAGRVQSWIDGRSLPPMDRLKRMATVLFTEKADLADAWIRSLRGFPAHLLDPV